MSEKIRRSDAAKALLSKSGIPDVDIPTGELHTSREFRLPEAMRESDSAMAAADNSESESAGTARSEQPMSSGRPPSPIDSDGSAELNDMDDIGTTGASKGKGSALVWVMLIAIVGAIVAAVVLRG